VCTDPRQATSPTLPIVTPPTARTPNARFELPRQTKTVRPNPLAERELRLLGNYRVLINADASAHVVTIVLVGEKRVEALLVQ